ncbi:hypothetical protein AURDEDRAFT_177704 [Auricularia subglabra TFB-10046 SS5]|uniref:Uncharacterized protein n=1 Tax=Auricularia subglabra (strain TFB-10046 / SS5) TaxID=717982 RepID=J0D3F2_AURST|nr:hypothetical protein AURDEDRAFT_177704 [Auricularia subglabra TFB-10046 SS5]
MTSADFALSLMRPLAWPRSAKQKALFLPELLRLYFDLLPNTGAISICMSVCTAWYIAGDYFLRRLHDVTRALTPFISDVPALRRLLCETDGVIAGTFADLFFRRGPGAIQCMLTPTFVLDLYFEFVYRDEVEELILAEGYTLDDEFEVGDVYPDCAVTGLPDDSYNGLLRFSKGGRYIDVVLTAETTANCVLRVEATGAMNFVTWDAAICMFPRQLLSLERSECLRIDHDPEGVPEGRLRGLDSHRWPEGPPGLLGAMYSPTTRWVADSRSWVVQLETDSVLYDEGHPCDSGDTLAVPSTYSWTVNGFTLQYERAEGPPRSKAVGRTLLVLPTQGCHLLASPALMYTYAVEPALADRFNRHVAARAATEGPFWITENVRLDDVLLTMKVEM